MALQNIDWSRAIQAVENLALAVNRLAESSAKQAVGMAVEGGDSTNAQVTKKTQTQAQAQIQDEGASLSDIASLPSTVPSSFMRGFNSIKNLAEIGQSGAPSSFDSHFSTLMGEGARKGMMPLVEAYSAVGKEIPDDVFKSQLKIQEKVAQVHDYNVQKLQRATDKLGGGDLATWGKESAEGGVMALKGIMELIKAQKAIITGDISGLIK